MRIIIGTAPGALRLAGRGRELSPAARRRLKWMDYYEEHSRNASLTCRYFGISRQTFYRWRKRYQPRRLQSLEDHTRRPRRVRQSTWSPELAQAVLELREETRWGKDKLAPLLRQAGWTVSNSMVGRILSKLRRRGLLVEAPRAGAVAVRRPRPPRPYAIRKPKDYRARAPGDLVQVDTLDLRPLPGVVFKHFTARDVVSRWDVLEVHTRATARIAATFLDAIQARMPFPVRAIQVDGGSEFQADFERACQERDIRLFVLPPRSPKLNGSVERAQRTHTEEFYEFWDLPWSVTPLNRKLRAWERIYNTVRPHQSLGFRTPRQYLRDLARAGKR
jgi:putative transposase